MGVESMNPRSIGEELSFKRSRPFLDHYTIRAPFRHTKNLSKELQIGSRILTVTPIQNSPSSPTPKIAYFMSLIF